MRYLYIELAYINFFQTLEIPIVYETYEEGDCSPDYEYPPRPSLGVASAHSSYTESGEGECKKVIR